MSIEKKITAELLRIKFPGSDISFIKEKNIKKLEDNGAAIDIDIELNFAAKKKIFNDTRPYYRCCVSDICYKN